MKKTIALAVIAFSLWMFGFWSAVATHNAPKYSIEEIAFGTTSIVVLIIAFYFIFLALINYIRNGR